MEIWNLGNKATFLNISTFGTFVFGISKCWNQAFFKIRNQSKTLRTFWDPATISNKKRQPTVQPASRAKASQTKPYQAAKPQPHFIDLHNFLMLLRTADLQTTASTADLQARCGFLFKSNMFLYAFAHEWSPNRSFYKPAAVSYSKATSFDILLRTSDLLTIVFISPLLCLIQK